ncbi:MAG: flagellar biosynthetic protein FliO [Terracidiphilus sp.]
MKESGARLPAGGWTGWLIARLFDRVIGRLGSRRRSAPRLALVERITLAPRQSLALVEAEGRRILVATSAEGASAFYPLDEAARPAARNAAPPAGKTLPGRASTSGRAARVSW